jgi:DNA-binding response OmpR family regulator
MILVVEDDHKVASFIERGLREAGYMVQLAVDGCQAEHLAETRSYDAIILDLRLPGKDGVDVCRSLRQHRVRTPILMLTARALIDDKVKGFSAGADDYLTKPFAFEELLARIEALIRRGSGLDDAPAHVGNLRIDRQRRRALCADRDVSLSAREFALLDLLVRRKGEIVTRAIIAEQVWGVSFEMESNVTDVTVNHLRRKLEHVGSQALIETIRGCGYALVETRKRRP